MAPQKTVTLPDDVYERVQRQAEAEGKTVDEMAAEAVQKHFAHQTLERLRQRGELQRRGKTDEEVEAIVEKAVTESRQEHRR